MTEPSTQYQYLTTASCAAYLTIATTKAAELGIPTSYQFLVNANTAWFHGVGTDHQAIANTLMAAGQTSFAQLLSSRDGQAFEQLKAVLAAQDIELPTDESWDARAEYAPMQVSTIVINATLIETAAEAAVAE